MKTKNRRRSKNIEIAPPEDKEMLKMRRDSEIGIRDWITQSNPRLKNRIPVKDQKDEGIANKINATNPGEGVHEKNWKNYRDSYPVQHLQPKEIKIEDNFQLTPPKGPIPKKRPKK